jgi:ADP-ribosylglycohydrolase
MNRVVKGLLGVTIGDALGLPYEFRTRAEMDKNPATDMIAFGTYNQPLGTWSDDSSLTFCLAESLLQGFDLQDITTKIVDWRYNDYWTARGEVFDVGIQTSRAIARLQTILHLENYKILFQQRYYGDEWENGNGSLMRILPMAFYAKGKELKEQFEAIYYVSALTHRHIRAAMACFIYVNLITHLLGNYDKLTAYERMKKDVKKLWTEISFAEAEKTHFQRIINENIYQIERKDIKSGGYVIETLEAVLWCFLRKDNFINAVLSAVNLGQDTDTVAAITGGISGIYYGLTEVPTHWITSLPRIDEIITLGNKLNKKYKT